MYEAARIVPCCNKPLCHQCIHLIEKTVKDTKYRCVLCEKEEQMPNVGFPLDKDIAEMLEKSIILIQFIISKYTSFSQKDCQRVRDKLLTKNSPGY